MKEKRIADKTIPGYILPQGGFKYISGDLPLINQEDYTPIVLTEKYILTTDTDRIVSEILADERRRPVIAAILTLSRLLLAVGGLLLLTGGLKTVGVVADTHILHDALGKFGTFGVGTTLLAVVVIYYASRRPKEQKVRLPVVSKIPSQKRDDIMGAGEPGYQIQPTEYQSIPIHSVLSHQLMHLVATSIQGNTFSSFTLFNELFKDKDVEYLNKRAGLNISPEVFTKLEITSQALPNYPLPALRSLLSYAAQIALQTEASIVGPMHLFVAYIRLFPILQGLLQTSELNEDILVETLMYIVRKHKKEEMRNPYDIRYPFHKTDGLAAEWIYGYTFVLDHFSKDINKKVSGDVEKFGIGHDNEVEAIVSIVGKLSKNNVLLIGDPGVGKSSLIKGLAQRINRSAVPQQLYNKRIIQLDINGLIANASKDGNMEKMIADAMHELEKAGNTILYIDEIQEIVPTRAEKSGHSIAGILLPHLLEGKFPVIGTINRSDYKKYFSAGTSFAQSFEAIDVLELTGRDSLEILESKIPDLESTYRLFVTFPALFAAVELAHRFVTDRKLPDSAVNVIESACSYAQSSGKNILTYDDVAKSVSLQTNIPVDNISADEASDMLNLESKLLKKIIGQDHAVKSIVDTLKRSRADIRDPNKPIGVFLFVGPTGVGKTHIAKTVSEEYFGHSHELVRIDMSEYQEVGSISKLLGSSGEGVSTAITLLDKVKANPYSVVLFDEIEKANPQILDLFLQLFDEGRLTSSNGETVNFTNTILICTSNIGSRMLLETLAKSTGQVTEEAWAFAKDAVKKEIHASLRPELINRFDEVVTFYPHSVENLTKITSLVLGSLSKRMAEKNIDLSWTDAIPLRIAQAAHVPGMGARPIRRFVQERIEGRIADEILAGNVKAGGSLVIDEGWI